MVHAGAELTIVEPALEVHTCAEGAAAAAAAVVGTAGKNRGRGTRDRLHPRKYVDDAPQEAHEDREAGHGPRGQRFAPGTGR